MHRGKSRHDGGTAPRIVEAVRFPKRDGALPAGRKKGISRGMDAKRRFLEMLLAGKVPACMIRRVVVEGHGIDGVDRTSAPVSGEQHGEAGKASHHSAPQPEEVR